MAERREEDTDTSEPQTNVLFLNTFLQLVFHKWTDTLKQTALSSLGEKFVKQAYTKAM